MPAHRGDQGNGYATQAVSAMAQWGHQTFGLSTIYGIAASGNVASCRVLEKSGFTLIQEAHGALHDWKGIIRTYKSSHKNRS